MRIRADPGVDEGSHRSAETMEEQEDCMIDPGGAGCPVCSLIDLLGRKWTLHLVWTLNREGPLRFNEIKRRAEGISPRVLSDRLDELAGEGLVERRDKGGQPPHVEYALTADGRELEDALQGLLAWARRRSAAVGREPDA